MPLSLGSFRRVKGISGECSRSRFPVMKGARYYFLILRAINGRAIFLGPGKFYQDKCQFFKAIGHGFIHKVFGDAVGGYAGKDRNPFFACCHRVERWCQIFTCDI